jgi:hypothetical protein
MGIVAERNINNSFNGKVLSKAENIVSESNNKFVDKNLFFCFRNLRYFLQLILALNAVLKHIFINAKQIKNVDVFLSVFFHLFHNDFC